MIYAMGTTVSIQAFGNNTWHLHYAINKAFGELRGLDKLFSVYDVQSEISKINSAAGTAEVAVSPETIDILAHAVSFSHVTNGSFDCTVEPLMRLWGFRMVQKDIVRRPSEKEIYKVLDAVGYNNITINPGEQKAGLTKRNASIDLGGIAVGYSVDRMAKILRDEGISSACINHSGDIFAIGTPPHEEGWKVGIPALNNHNELSKTFSLKDQALSTSGPNEKFVTVDGKRQCHIMDTETGHPSEKWQTVSVVAQSSLLADVWSTALFNTPDSISKNENTGMELEVCIVDNKGGIHSTSY